jgi:glycosyltransferase involved in cell wall biosynthesis
MPDSRRESMVAGTVVDSERLPAATVLARTYLDHHPGHDFVILVVDGAPETAEATAYQVVGPDWLQIGEDELLRMATCYPRAQLLSSLTPVLLRQLLDQYAGAVYLAPEIKVYAAFQDVTATQEIVLAPRSLAPLTKPGREPSTFDQDFLAVGQGAQRFLDFWVERARHAPPEHDQNWLDLVPGFFRYEATRDPGIAAAGRNVHERPLSDQDGVVTAGGSPLRFFNFSGYDPGKPWLLDGTRLSESPTLKGLCDSYRADLLAAGYSKHEQYRYSRLPDGSALTAVMRQQFHEVWLESELAQSEQSEFTTTPEEVPPHPFGDDRGAAFQQWFSSPDSSRERNAGLNRLLRGVWSSRTDLQVAFPQPFLANAEGFRQWCRTHGVAEGLVPEWALPREPAPISAPVDEFGVNFAGYLTAELGLGEMGRIMLRAVQHADIPVASIVEERSIARSCRAELDAPDTIGEARFPVSVLAVNADFTQPLLDNYPELGHQRYRIGLWAWELEDFPPEMRAAFPLVDEVWTVSDFTRRAIAAHSPVPVKTIPVPVPDPGAVSRSADGPVQFLFAFDFNSTGQRKNPWGLVTAFNRAFPDRDDVRLVIKATNGHLNVAAAERLRVAIGGDPRIRLLEGYLSVDELADLYASSSAYVSLHRSEGFGLTVAEAMVRGMPVIATDYSSTTEFFNAEVGWPIPYTMTEVGDGWRPYQADGLWADPDLDEAARAMRVVADDPAEARRRGKAAREYILRTRPMDAAADWVRAQLENAYQVWQARQQPSAAPTLARRVRHRLDRLTARRDGPVA